MIKNYDLIIGYHPGKENVVADALSRNSTASLAYVKETYFPLLFELRTTGPSLTTSDGALIARFMVKPMMIEEIRSQQDIDPDVAKIKESLQGQAESPYRVRDDGVILFMDWIWVPKSDRLRNTIMSEVHVSAYAMHPGGTKTYRNLREIY